jgi:cystathionine beta-lyase
MVAYGIILALEAALAAYRDGQSWLEALLHYLESNRDFTMGFIRDRMPDVSMTKPEGTFLAWLDCRKANLPCRPSEFFLKHAMVALNEGSSFGPGGEGFVRLNYGCPRTLLEQGLERMARSLNRLR